LLTLSISDGVLRYSFDKMFEKRKVFSNGLWLSVFSSVILLIFLPIFNFVPGISNYKFLFWLLFLTNTFTVLFSNFSRALNLVSLISITSIINTLLTATLNIVLIGGFRLGLLGFLLANILGNIIGCFIYYFAGKFKNYTVFSIDIPLLKQMFVYCLPLIPNALFWWINSSINRYFLTILTSLSAVGLFSVANKIPSILSMVTGIFQQAWDISSIEVYDSNERDTFFSNIFNAYTFLMGLVSILLIV
ncbi:oligosaccharide flippase family protein, partial [Latilactobacillus sakei]